MIHACLAVYLPLPSRSWQAWQADRDFHQFSRISQIIIHKLKYVNHKNGLYTKKIIRPAEAVR